MKIRDKNILRELAKRYVDVFAKPRQKELREMWRLQNSLKDTRPLIDIRTFAWREMPQYKFECEDPFNRTFEEFFRRSLFLESIGGDNLFEPWLTVQATHVCKGWGVSINRNTSDDPRGSYKVDYPIKELSDIEKLRAPWHEIDEKATAEKGEKAHDLIGDIISVNVDRGPAYRMWQGDISTDLGNLRGIEHFMMDMVVNPDWLHRLAKFMGDGILRTHEEAEARGDWGMCAHQNQSMPYSEELADPAPNVNGVKRSQLWGYMAAQEFTGVSPAMHEEFLLRYQLPIISAFGLSAYGCCEDLTNKFDMLQKIPNLRRIAVAPSANAARCAERIGRNYVLSYRPSPTDMVGYGFDRDRIRRILKRDLESCRECHVDITLKDVETVEHDPDRVKRWVALTRQVIDEVF